MDDRKRLMGEIESMILKLNDRQLKCILAFLRGYISADDPVLETNDKK